MSDCPVCADYGPAVHRRLDSEGIRHHQEMEHLRRLEAEGIPIAPLIGISPIVTLAAQRVEFE